MFDEMMKRVELLHLLKISSRLIGSSNEIVQRIHPFSPITMISRTLGTTFQTTSHSNPQKIFFDRNHEKFCFQNTDSEVISVHPMLSMERYFKIYQILIYLSFTNVILY